MPFSFKEYSKDATQKNHRAAKERLPIFNPHLILFHYLWVGVPNTEFCREDFTQQGG